MSGLPWVLLPSFLAELGLPLWLTMQNLNVPKWKENRGEEWRLPLPIFVSRCCVRHMPHRGKKTIHTMGFWATSEQSAAVRQVFCQPRNGNEQRQLWLSLSQRLQNPTLGSEASVVVQEAD